MAVAPFEDFQGNYFPAQTAASSTTSFVSAPATGDALAIGLNYFQQNATSFGLSPADLTNSKVTSRYTDSDSGITHIYLQQTFNGLPVMDAMASINLMPDGRVITASANFVRGLSYPATITTPIPNISADVAVSTVAAGALLPVGNSLQVTSVSNDLDKRTVFADPAISSDPIPAKLAYIPSPGGGLELGWHVNVHAPSGEYWFDTVVSASGGRSGQVARVVDWANKFVSPGTASGTTSTSGSLVASGSTAGSESTATSSSALAAAAIIGPPAFYNVFPRDPEPVQDPLYGIRDIESGIEDAIASPFGWHDTNFIPGVEFTTTNGNNVFARPFVGASPDGGPGLNFDFPFNIAGNPAATPPDNAAAATTNLFYWANLAHDVAYRHGFTEGAGNFQVTNRTSAGLGNDPVLATAQVASPMPLNNAFMATPPDGQSPSLVMGLFNTAAPFRDSAFDGTIILHEYAHGISNRLTGGPANASALQALQSGGMGEGWSDWFALIQTIKSTDTAATPRTSGQWTLGQPLGGPGVRRVPYSFDMTIDPLTFNSYNGDIFPQQNNSEVHNAGEIWCSVLWDITWLLINKYGHSSDLYGKTGGENEALDIILQGMKLQPVVPSFTQARDAIIAADLALNAGANYELLWSAFARRGLGVTAFTVNSNSLVVFTSFDPAPGAAHAVGTVFNDADGDQKRDPNEIVVPGITVYNDSNNNSKLDASEIRTTTDANGAYSIAFLSSQTVRIRLVLPANFSQTTPANNAAHTFFINSGQTVAGKNFGIKGLPGQISGVKFNDADADGVRDAGEAGVSGVMIYADLNNDGRVSIVEPSAVTDFFGRYTLKNLTAGNGYIIREVVPPGRVQTVPGATALPNPFAHSGIIVQSGQTTTGINFGDTTAPTTPGGEPTGATGDDFGDAPLTYGSARHGILPGFAFRLGARIDAELGNQPTADATGDDVNPVPPPPPDPLPDPPPPPPPNPDDEDGIVFVGGGITPGLNASIQVTVSTGGNDPGKLQGWIDFNRNGKFDSNEKVVSNLILGAGVHTVTFPVPATASQGTTIARFRYGYEPDLGPTGPSVAGEVEDYSVISLPAVPVANPDVFPLPGEPLIKPNSVDYPLDVLANDTPTLFGPPQIVAGSFPAVLPGTGSTLELNATGDLILYTAGPGVVAPMQETFTYQVTDGNSVSAPGTVTINVSLADPIAFDDTFTLPIPPFSDPIQNEQLPVMENDLFPQPDTQIISVVDISGNPNASATIDPADPTMLLFSTTVGFRGTVIFQYTIDDSDPTTSPSSRFVTVQVVDSIGGIPDPVASGYLAELEVSILDAITGLPINVVSQGDEFLVRVTSQDLRPGGDEFNRGVESAYLDLLFDSDFIEPVPDPTNPLGFKIEFEPTYTVDRLAFFNDPGPGEINEAGGTHPSNQTDPPEGVGPGEVAVFTVTMRAKAPTPAGQPIQVVGDPADIVERTEITLMPDDPDGDPSPVELTDEQTFLRASGSLTILGAGQGQFVNFVNPLDVNQDASVSPIDALLIINNLNTGGSRSLAGGSVYVSGNAMVDVNMDSHLSAIDALLVVNHLNAKAALAAFIESARGEGESAGGTATAAGTSPNGDLADLALLDTAAPSNTTSMPTSSGPALLTTPTTTTTSTSSTTTPTAAASSTQATTSTKVDADAADDLFASLEEARTELRSRFRRR
jgi:hypothetical protein